MLKIDFVTVDCADAKALGRWWAQALDYDFWEDESGDVAILPRDGSKRRVLFQNVPEGKSVKNRYHFDLRPDDQEAEVARLESMGAKRIDIGQKPESVWIVMADPEGNEFCVLRAIRPDEAGTVEWGD